ncbi:PUS5 (YLR165C) [Zygosaccharomyces parabailii]|nr:PUS5 (YLR165C) [Zygosaccharomyces parabailii]CDH09523.1 related to 21S rRNA pseudouridine(2819) synthase [Zygosaccharomyces bailii ISA1307]
MIRERKPFLQIVYECNHYLLVNKPPNVLSQPGDSNRWFLRGVYKNQHDNRCKVLLDELRAQRFLQSKDIMEWRLVQRLDCCVTGGILIAKNKNAAACFSRNLKLGGNKGFKLKRKYVALVQEIPDSKTHLKDCGLIDKNGMISKYRRFDENCILVELVTGKKHQVRQHLSKELKQPILNDIKYSGLQIAGADAAQIALHSAFVKTLIGQQNREHLIPMIFRNDETLWNRRYLEPNGQFIPEIRKLLLEDWDF